jgi:hypothetical protein
MPLVLRPPSEERVSLTTRLAGLGRSRKWVSVACGVFALAGAVLAAVLVACALDAWLHLSPLARAFALVGTLTAAGVVWFRSLAPALRLPTGPLAVALDLEDRFPPLNDSLASAVSFLADPARDEDRGVSRRLRIAAVRRAERLAERHDFHRLVPVGRCWRLFWLCALVVCVAAPLGLWNTTRTATALVRLADPFGAHPWPAKTRIELLLPEKLPARLPKGDAFELRFAVRGEIPDRAAVTFHVIGGEEFEEVYPLAKADPKNPTALPPAVSASNGPVAAVSARLEPGRIAQSFQFRVRANDADTGWQRVDVVPPPRLVPLDGRATPQVGVTPPAYTGLRPFDLPDGAAVMEVPVGTVVSLRAAADVRLAAAVLTFQGDRSAVEQAAGLAPLGSLDPAVACGAQLLADAIGADIPLVLSADGKVMGATFTPSVSGMYALKLTDETGLVGTRLLEIRLTPDPMPDVTLLRPALGRDPPVVVPTAALAVHVAVEDKRYGLRRTFLEYRVGRDGRLRTIPLPDSRASVAGVPGLLHPAAFESQVALPVSTFLRDDGTPVRDGDTVILRAAATDWDDVTVLKEPGRSGEFELRIASRESVEGYLQKELGAMRPDLLRAREQQRDATAKTADAKPQPDGTLSPADRERLMSAEQSQRQVQGKVADPRDGLRAKADMLRELARVNGLPKSLTTDRLEAVADELGRLADRDLSAVGPLLGDIRQMSVQPKPGQEQAVPQMLTRAARHQKTVEDGLTNLIDLLAQWGGAAEVRGDARMLRDSVLREAANAEKLPERVPPGKAPEALPPDQRADLDRAAAKLDLLADQAGGLLSRAAKLAAEKAAQAAESKAAADKKERDADDLKKKARQLPPGPDRTELEAKAAQLADEAAELRSAADKAQAEAEALSRGVKNAGGQALPDELRKAAEAVRANRQGEAAGLERSAAARLDRLANDLAEKPADDVPELARKKKNAADQLDALAGAQDELRKKAAEAARIKDDEQRADALKRLAPEQQKLIDQTRDLVQRLTRERAEDAAKDGRQALDKMEAARDDLERGDDPTNAQQDATAKLDQARDRLDRAVAKAPQELSDEKRRKLADLVKGLLDRQKAAVAEAARMQEDILKAKKWPRPLLTSYRDLEDRERALAPEVRTLADREFAELPVFARVVKDAADGLEKAADRAKVRWQDARDADPDAAFDPDLEKANDSRVRRPMDLAVRRLEQVLEALKPDSPTAKKDEKKQDGPPAGGGGGPMQMGGGGNGEVIPPLAQLKALRSLQADLNQQTAEFDKLHPDRAKLSDEDREDLKELEDAQREITALFEQMAKLFQQKDMPPDAPQANPKGKAEPEEMP